MEDSGELNCSMIGMGKLSYGDEVKRSDGEQDGPWCMTSQPKAARGAELKSSEEVTSCR